MPWLTVILVVVLLFGIVYAWTGVYVSAKYGADMVGSHLHSGIAEKWFVRLLKWAALLTAVFMFMMFTVFINGDWSWFFETVGYMLKLTFIDIPWMVIKGFIGVMFKTS